MSNFKGLSNIMSRSLSRLAVPAKFGGHRQCSSGDIIVLVFHVISQDHAIKGSCDFMGRSQSR